jgi:hypothetical protein
MRFVIFSTATFFLISCSEKDPLVNILKEPSVNEEVFNMDPADYPDLKLKEHEAVQLHYYKDATIDSSFVLSFGQTGKITCKCRFNDDLYHNFKEAYLVITQPDKIKTNFTYSVPNSFFYFRAQRNLAPSWYDESEKYREMSGHLQFLELSDTCISIRTDLEGLPYRNHNFFNGMSIQRSPRGTIFKNTIRFAYPGQSLREPDPKFY